MAKIIGLPKLSPTMEEGTLASWSKQEGDAVEVDDLLAEVETDKATMEFRSFDKGVLLKILAEEGDTLAPDAPVAIIGEEGEDISALLSQAKNGGAAPAPAAKEQAAAKDTPSAASDDTEADDTETDDAASDDAASDDRRAKPVEAREAQTAGRILASPVVRKIAREKHIDLADIEGSGPRGRIVKSDLDGVSARSARKRPAQRGPLAESSVEKLSQMRKAIARRLTESKQTVPHFYLTIDVDAEPLMNARKSVNAVLESDGIKISVNDIIIKAVASALKRYPRANASFTDQGIEMHNRVDISVAVAVPDGLMTPVIRNADQLGAAQIGQQVRALAKRARDKKLQPEEYTNGTFSVSNLGMYGIEDFSAVINPPEGAILAVGTVREEPVVKDGQVVPGKRMRMTLSCDHRVIDGAIGAEFLQVLRTMLESPITMLV